MIENQKYPRTPHFEELRRNIVAIARECGATRIVIEEKLDGANSGMQFSEAGDILTRSRGNFLQGGYREKQFDMFRSWADWLADDLIDADTPSIKQLVDVAVARGASVLGVQDVPREDTRKYGIVAAQADDSRADGRTERVTHIVEKPDPADAPSTLAVVGRYVLEAAIFDHLRSTKRGAGNEIQLTDGIASLMRERAVYAHRYEGTRYDCGNKAGMFEATVALGRKYHGLLPR